MFKIATNETNYLALNNMYWDTVRKIFNSKLKSHPLNIHKIYAFS